MVRAIAIFCVVAILTGGGLSHVIHADEHAVQGASDKRSPVPSAEAQKQAKQLVLEVFSSRLAQAKSGPEKIQLAKDLLRLGTETNDDLASRFVLYIMARDTALESGDWETCLSAVLRQGKDYQVDTLVMKSDLLAKMAKAAVGTKGGQELYPKFREVTEEAIVQDRYEVARNANALLLQWAQKVRDAEIAKQVTALGQELIQLEADHGKVKNALELLKTQPSDASANTAVGRYQCFIKGDWKNGLPLLAKGSDKTLSQLATDELLEKPDPLRVGDGWWNIAQTLEGRAREKVLAHTGDWYRQAPPQSGLLEERLKSRLAKLPGSGTRGPVAAKSSSSSPSTETPSGAAAETSVKEAIEAAERIGGNLQLLKKQYSADAVLIRGHRYKVFKEVLTWNEAKEICVKLGGHLLVLEDQGERNDVGPLNKIGPSWIGASFNPRGQPVWVNGAAFNFKTTQPDKEYQFIALSELNFMKACTSDGKAAKGPRVAGFICEWDR